MTFQNGAFKYNQEYQLMKGGGESSLPTHKLASLLGAKIVICSAIFSITFKSFLDGYEP
jgi:hypothetical protein